MCAFDFNVTNKAICQVNRQKSVTFAPKASLFEAFFHRDGDGHGSADHRVVAHADQAHHLYVRRHGGRTGELSVGVHTAHSIGHTIRRRTCEKQSLENNKFKKQALHLPPSIIKIAFRSNKSHQFI